MKGLTMAKMGWGFWFGGFSGLALAVAFYVLSDGNPFSFLLIPVGLLMGLGQGYMMAKIDEGGKE